MSVFSAPPKRRGGGGGASRTQALSLLLLLLVSLLIFYPQIAAWVTGRSSSSSSSAAASLAGAGADLGPVLVSYSYFEKDAVQVRPGLCLSVAVATVRIKEDGRWLLHAPLLESAALLLRGSKMLCLPLHAHVEDALLAIVPASLLLLSCVPPHHRHLPLRL